MKQLHWMTVFVLIAHPVVAIAADLEQESKPAQESQQPKKPVSKNPPEEQAPPQPRVSIVKAGPPGPKSLALKALLDRCSADNKRQDRCEGREGIYTSGAEVQSFGALVRDDGAHAYNLTWSCPAEWDKNTLLDITVASARRVNRGVYRVRTVAECGESKFNWEAASSGPALCCVLIERHSDTTFQVRELIYGTLRGPNLTDEVGVRLYINRALQSFRLAKGWPRYVYQGELFGSRLVPLDGVKEKTLSVCPIIDDEPCAAPDAILHFPAGGVAR